MTQLYSVYGLILESPSAIPGLAQLQPDDSPLPSDSIRITIGKPRFWSSETRERLFPSQPPGQQASSALQLYLREGGSVFHLIYPDGAEFAVDVQTRHVWGWFPPTLTVEDLATYLVGPVMGFILRQRRILALHASSFCIGDHAFAICGAPQTGKSTAAAALSLRGVPILCEDIAALREDGALFVVSPGYPRINLWPDSAANLLGSGAELPRITPTWEKRFLSLNGSGKAFERRPYPLAAIYVIAPREGDAAPRIETISPREAVLLLVQNTYMNYLLDKTQRAGEFDSLVRLVSCVPVKRLVPHRDPARIGVLCDLLQKDASLSVPKPGFEELPAGMQP